ncbi:MAG: sulfite exporter TauE/SafE family protein [Rubritepida sp.]|nr:sulfite exporter TauE/SafE family protein [Rubritepida sp.]
MPDILSIALVFLLAGFVKGVIGLGLPTIAMGLLGLWLAPAQAAVLLTVPGLVTNLVQMRGPAFLSLLHRLRWMLVGVVAGTAAGFWLWGGLGGRWASIGLALALMAYAALGLATVRPVLSPPAARRLAFPTGAATGAITPATGVFMLPMAPWLQANQLPRDDMVQALGIALFVSALSLGAALWWTGGFAGGAGGGSVLALLPALGGQWLGARLRRVLPEAVFRRVFFLGILALGSHLLWRSA